MMFAFRILALEKFIRLLKLNWHYPNNYLQSAKSVRMKIEFLLLNK